MSGVLTGGWDFVIAAYAITALVLAAYGWSLASRLRDERARLARGIHERDDSH